MEIEQIEEIIMGIIVNAGEAKALAYEGLRGARRGEFMQAAELIEQARMALNGAHAVQTDVIRREVEGVDKVPVSIMFVHAQDHLMTVISDIQLIEEMIEMQKEIFELKQRIKVV
ncbi:MAG: PTS lactose/cellobiose transporter subunit IIA [Fusobacteria bacterium]|nr:PTS lactose/cellobiose transporter subunit IIA [Fusobacteriota bacterium]